MSLPTPARPRLTPGLFRAFWRWHFYASFLVVPVLAVLAATGLIYLFRFELEPLLHSQVMTVDPPDGATRPYALAAQLAAVEAEFPDVAISLVREGRDPQDATAFSIERPDGTTTDVFVDPWRAEVLGSLNPDTTLSGYAIRLHADLMAGRWGDHLVELAACWAVVMAMTGYYLFLAGRRARARRLVAGATGAALRHRHALIGSLAGVGMLFMVVSGLPWTGVWGEQVQKLATAQGSSLWSLDPGGSSHQGSTLDESLPHSHVSSVPWAQAKAVVPDSGSDRVTVANLDTAVTVAERAGLRRPFSVVLPADENGTYSVMGDAFGDPSRERTVHVDRYSGTVRGDYGFEDYPVAAKVVSQGIGLHEGRSLGPVSFAGAAAFCLAVLALCVTGPVMWWRRRPTGSTSIGAPRGRLPLRQSRWLLAVVVVLGILLPVFGISLLVVLALDQLVVRRFGAIGHRVDSV